MDLDLAAGRRPGPVDHPHPPVAPGELDPQVAHLDLNTPTKPDALRQALNDKLPQDIHILKNPESPDGSPWYSTGFRELLVTPDWTFQRTALRRWPGA